MYKFLARSVYLDLEFYRLGGFQALRCFLMHSWRYLPYISDNSSHKRDTSGMLLIACMELYIIKMKAENSTRYK